MSQPNLRPFSTKALIVAAIAGVLSIIGFFISREAFAVGYLTAYVYFLAITIGVLPLIFFHHLTSGHWGFTTRRVMEVITQSIPLMAILALPILINLDVLYAWADAELVSHDKILKAKVAYLNKPFFVIRMVLYFVIWWLFAVKLRRMGNKYEYNTTTENRHSLEALSGVGLILFSLTVTFASIDLVMSLEPHWFSTIYGLIFMVAFGLSGFATALYVSLFLRKRTDIEKTWNTSRCNDLGSMLFAGIMLWAYVSLSQFIIIWSANLKEEAPWYLNRFNGGWYMLILFVIGFHFVFPFFLLLMRQIKKNYQILFAITGLVLLMRYFDLIWYIKPVFYPELTFHWLDFTCLAFIGGLWKWQLFKNLSETCTMTIKGDPIDEQEHH